MASFTYTVWSDAPLPTLMSQLQLVFGQLKFTVVNPRTGKVHLWSEEGESIVDPAVLSISENDLPLGAQWWRGEDDLHVSVAGEVDGFMCSVTLVGFSREEQAEIARLLILHVAPEKRNFPEDFDVFRLSAE